MHDRSPAGLERVAAAFDAGEEGYAYSYAAGVLGSVETSKRYCLRQCTTGLECGAEADS